MGTSVPLLYLQLVSSMSGLGDLSWVVHRALESWDCWDRRSRTYTKGELDEWIMGQKCKEQFCCPSECEKYQSIWTFEYLLRDINTLRQSLNQIVYLYGQNFIFYYKSKNHFSNMLPRWAYSHLVSRTAYPHIRNFGTPCSFTKMSIFSFSFPDSLSAHMQLWYPLLFPPLVFPKNSTLWWADML